MITAIDRVLSLRFFAAILLFAAGLGSTAAQTPPKEITPPDKYFRTVDREASGATPFHLLRDRRAVFSLVVSDPDDEVLQTAASDFGGYMQKRWHTQPSILRQVDGASGDLIVLATMKSLANLPEIYQQAAARDGDLSAQAFVIERVPLPGDRSALLCLGGMAIGARYATIEILRRMIYERRNAQVNLDHVRDEPYSTWRAIYINDSAHQANNYDPNLIYPVDTYRWTLDKWKRYIDQMAFFRYNVLQIWLVPQMFTPKALQGGGVYDYVRDTLRAVADYARLRGIKLCLTNGINVSVDSGTLLDTLPVYKSMPVYRYLSPNKPEEKKLMLDLWDYWSKALPEVSIWQLFPGDPGGCHEKGCGPETYVDLALEITQIIKKNNPKAVIDFCPWQFFGWGPSWPTQLRKDTARIDRGYRYLISKADSFPPDTIFSPNLNDATSAPPVHGGGIMGGNTVQYIEAIHRKNHLIHTWTYFVTEGEGWLNHHDRISDIIRQRDVEARYPISGGICYTMTPSLNILNQFACAEAFWDPTVTKQEIMERYTEGIFGTRDPRLIEIFPSFDVGPTVGYTFAKAPDWNPDYAKIRADMERNRTVLEALSLQRPTRFDLIESATAYRDELVYFTNLYEENSRLGQTVAKARSLVKHSPEFRQTPDHAIHMTQAQQALHSQRGESKQDLQDALLAVKAFDIPAMKARYRAKHYQIFIDYPTDFTALLPQLIDGFFDAFGADFLQPKDGTSSGR